MGLLTQTTLIGPGGAFTLTDIPVGSYIVHIKSANTLAKNISIDLTGGDVTDISATLPAGDASNDNQIDVADFGALVNAFGSASDGLGDFVLGADFNGDGTVDITDFSLLLNNFGAMGAI